MDPTGIFTIPARRFMWGLHKAGWEVGGIQMRLLIREAQKVAKERKAKQIGRNHLEAALERLAQEATP